MILYNSMELILNNTHSTYYFFYLKGDSQINHNLFRVTRFLP